MLSKMQQNQINFGRQNIQNLCGKLLKMLEPHAKFCPAAAKFWRLPPAPLPRNVGKNIKNMYKKRHRVKSDKNAQEMNKKYSAPRRKQCRRATKNLAGVCKSLVAWR
jgi:hypothetical protein